MTTKQSRRKFLKSAAAATITIPAISATTSAASADMVWPMSGYITSPYGPRNGGYHYGVDIGHNGQIGTPIYAARGGTAYTAYDSGGYGNYVYINHENGYRTEYGHVNSFAISDGESVSQGQHIAGMGEDGNATGPHVHFEIQNGSDHYPIPGNDGQNVTAGTGIPYDYPNLGGSGGSGSSYSWPVYRNGDQGEAVYTIQYLLEQHGYDLQYHDGIYGSEVTSNVKSFQSAQGLSVDGIVGPNTWSSLIVTVQDANNDPYWATYAAQHQLRYDEGYSISVDGYYGSETKNAIESFQSSAGIGVDGIVGPNTWRALVDIGN